MSINERAAETGPCELVGAAAAALARLLQIDLSTVSNTDVLAQVSGLQNLITQAETARMAVVHEVDRRGLAIATGASSTAAWLQGTHRERPATAKKLLTLGESLTERHQDTADALASATISTDHAAVICRALDDLPDTIDDETRAGAEKALLELAAGNDPLTLARLARHLTYTSHPDGDAALAEQEARIHKQRDLSLSQNDDGSWHLRGLLEPYPGAQLWAILDSLGAPRPSTSEGPDPRTPGQRRADALTELCERQLTQGDLPTQGGQRPTVIVTTTWETLSGSNATAGAARLPTNAPISVGELRRIACDAGVIPVVLGGDSMPLDYGRHRYTVPPHLRRIVLTRDENRCVIPGCPNVPRHCHHIAPWSQGGATTLDNLASLCGHHHRWIHQGNEHRIRPNPGRAPTICMGPAP